MTRTFLTRTFLARTILARTILACCSALLIGACGGTPIELPGFAASADGGAARPPSAESTDPSSGSYDAGGAPRADAGSMPAPPDPADPLRILVREVVPDGDSGGDVVWELKSELGYLTYRAERIESFYNGDAWVARG